MRTTPNQTTATDELKRANVMIVGDAERAEMRPLVDWLNENILPVSRSVMFPEIATALKTSLVRIQDKFGVPRAANHSVEPMFQRDAEERLALATDEIPDLIVILQGWSNEYSTTDVNRLLGFAPLARVVVCYGAWCESDGRNHNLWPFSVRVPVWAAIHRIDREWKLVQAPNGKQPLPWSASREEAFAADQSTDFEKRPATTVMVDSSDADFRQFLCEVLTANGHLIVAEASSVVLFDADPWGPPRSMALTELREQHPEAEFVALMNLATPTEIQQLHDYGIVNVIPKMALRSCELTFI